MPVGIAETFYSKVLDNEAFTISETFSVSGGGTAKLHLANPQDSGKTLVLVDVNISGDGDFTARLHDEFDSAPSGGSSIEIQAMYLDSGGANDNGVAEANENVSFNDGPATFISLGGGQGSASVGGSGGLPSLAVAEGREIVVEVENTTSNNQSYSITIIYFEKND